MVIILVLCEESTDDINDNSSLAEKYSVSTLITNFAKGFITIVIRVTLCK